jgi:hypothetical protein
MRVVRTGPALGALAAVLTGGAACNAIFSIREGTLDQDVTSSSGAGGAGSAVSGSTGSDGSGGADGGAIMSCPPYELPAQCDAKYLSDGDNCCIPGRSCQGGACVEGRCQPVVIVADATGDARGIGVAGDKLLWATGCTGQVRTCGKDGSNNIGLPVGLHCTPTLAVGGDRVYWIEYNGPLLNTAPIDGSAEVKIVAEVPIDGAVADFARLAIDGTNAYWAMNSPGGVWFAPLSGDHVKALPLASDASSMLTKERVVRPYGVAVDATHVYWSDVDGNAIKRRSLSSLGDDILADAVVSSEAGPRDIALDAKNIYWITSEGRIRSRPKDGSGVPVTLASGQTGAESIIVDSQYIYWTNWVDGGEVNRVPNDGGGVETMASGQKSPWSITQDCGTIYWSNHNMFGTGEIVKITK